MMVVSVLLGLVVLVFLGIIVIAVVRGQPVPQPSAEERHQHPSYGPYSGPEHSGSWVMRAAAQGLDPMGRHADWIHPVEAADIVARGGRRFDE